MTITYPLSTPTGGATPAQIMIYAQDVVSSQKSPFTFASQTFVHQGQAWGASVTLPPMKRDWAEPWISFLIALKGKKGYFLLSDPNGLTPQGLVSGTVRVNGANQVGDVLAIDGMTPNLVNAFKAGDYIQLGSGASARLHKIVTDVTANSSGGALVDIWPDLRASPADNDIVTYQNAAGLFRLTSNQRAWNINQMSSYGITFDCEEYVW